MMPWTRARRRARLVARLLVPACPDCPANPGRWCDPAYRGGLSRIGSRPEHYIHDTRLAAAVHGGWADRGTVTAQYGTGPLPAALSTITARR